MRGCGVAAAGGVASALNRQPAAMQLQASTSSLGVQGAGTKMALPRAAGRVGGRRCGGVVVHASLTRSSAMGQRLDARPSVRSRRGAPGRSGAVRVNAM